MANPRKIFSKIYNQYIDKIYRFIFLKVSSQEIAQDLTSETFLRGWKAFQAKHKGKGDETKVSSSPFANARVIENPQAFLYKIARNLVTDHYREKGKTRIVSADYVKITDPRTNLEEKAVLSSDLDTIKMALTNLREDYQNVIIWHYLDDFSISEIAKIMDKSEEATRVQLHRALKALKNKLYGKPSRKV